MGLELGEKSSRKNLWDFFSIVKMFRTKQAGNSMRPVLVKFIVILFTLSIGSAVAQGADPLIGKSFTIQETKWEFYKNGIVFVSGGYAREGITGKYKVIENEVFLKTKRFNLLE